VLFIHHDQSQSFDRRENRRAGAHRHTTFSPAKRPPGVVPLPDRETTVQNRNGIAEHAPHSPDGLGCQCDLRNEEDGPASVLECLPNRLQVDQRLSTPRNPEEQRSGSWFKTPDRLDGMQLFRCQGTRWRRDRFLSEGIPHLFHLIRAGVPRGDQGSDQVVREP
jgi:hypothetical protein